MKKETRPIHNLLLYFMYYIMKTLYADIKYVMLNPKDQSVVKKKEE